ncbi:MAG: bifunctional diguanylate cyclase/phosphodiesterase [Gammaproteobacteria bacterium]|nr:bifunctional diguanylate cyclase/phosphodiesterase [Gammaproteobacteria bacterium]
MTPTDDAKFYLELLRAYIDSANDAFFVLCDEMKFHVSNKRTENWLGQSEETLTAHNRRIPITDLLGDHDTVKRFVTAFKTTLSGKPTQVECLIKPNNSIARWVEINMNRVNVDEGDLVICVARDVTAKKEQSATLERLAHYDPLTDLPNRAHLRNILDDAIKNSKKESVGVALALLDLDLFKEINDTLGHQVGDVFLQQISLRLVSAAPANATITRFGGDEFALVLPDTDEAAAREISRSILQSLHYPFALNTVQSRGGMTPKADISLGISASIGIATFPRHANNTETLLRRAEIAMYQAKKAHVDLAVYSEEKDQHNVIRLTMLGELQHGIEAKQLSLDYQPIIDLGKMKIISMEALIRWHRPDNDEVQPDIFIPLAEQTGLIKPITWWALDSALQQCAHWKNSGLVLNASVNISPHTLYDMELANHVEKLIQKWSVNPNQLILEITESAVMADSERALEIFRRLNSVGVQLAIDDFGTGHSSLGYLKRLPVDIIKIDKSFVINMLKDKSDAMIVHAIINLAQNLGLRVTAEGVESQDVCDMLVQLGCNHAQGFYFGKPVDADALGQQFSNPKYLNIRQ